MGLNNGVSVKSWRPRSYRHQRNVATGRELRREAERLARKEAKKQQSAQKFCSAAHPPVEVA